MLTINRRLEDADHQSKVRSLPKSRESCEKGDSADAILKSCRRVLANLSPSSRSGSSWNNTDFCFPSSEILVIVVPFCNASGMIISDTMGLSASGGDATVDFWGIASLTISADILARRFVSLVTHSVAPCWDGMMVNTGERIT